MRYTDLRTLLLLAPTLAKAFRAPRAAEPEPERAGTSSLPTIAAVVASYYGVAREDLAGKGRQHSIAQARHVAMYLSKLLPSPMPSFTDVGEFFKRDHTTVIVAYRKIEALRKKDRTLARQLDELERKITSGAPLAPLGRFIWSEDPTGALRVVPAGDSKARRGKAPS